MPQLRRHLRSVGSRKIPFVCPECSAGLFVDSDQSVSGTCPACGGWICSPKNLQPMPVMVRPEEKRRLRPRFRAQGTRVSEGQYRCSISPDVILDADYESRKEMKGFYRFLWAIGGVVGLCMAMIYLLRR